MKRLICLVLLVSVLGQLFAENESSLKESMLKELTFLRRTFLSIEKELELTKESFSLSLKANEKRQKHLKLKIESLEAEKLQVEGRLKRLEKDYNLLNDSKDSWSNLTNNYDVEIEILEGQVRTWRTVAIVSVVILIGAAVYMAVR